MHAAAAPLRTAGGAAEELGEQLAGRHALGQGMAVPAVGAEDDVFASGDAHRRRRRSPLARRTYGRRRESARADAIAPVALRSGGSGPSSDKGIGAGLCSDQRVDSLSMMHFARRQARLAGDRFPGDGRKSLGLEGQYDRDADSPGRRCRNRACRLAAASPGEARAARVCGSRGVPARSRTPAPDCRERPRSRRLRSDSGTRGSPCPGRRRAPGCRSRRSALRRGPDDEPGRWPSRSCRSSAGRSGRRH